MIGLAAITFRRHDCLYKCLESLEKNDWGGASIRVVVADEFENEAYAPVLSSFPRVSFDFAEHKNVARAKNRAFHYLLVRGCEQLFLLEADTLILSPETCLRYIDYAAEHGIEHMNYSQFSQSRHEMFLLDGILCSRTLTAQFSYYTRKAVLAVGFMDENYHNAWEHVVHTTRIANAGLTTPVGAYADLPDAMSYVREIEGAPSVIAQLKAEVQHSMPISNVVWQGGVPVSRKSAVPPSVLPSRGLGILRQDTVRRVGTRRASGKTVVARRSRRNVR